VGLQSREERLATLPKLLRPGSAGGFSSGERLFRRSNASFDGFRTAPPRARPELSNFVTQGCQIQAQQAFRAIGTLDAIDGLRAKQVATRVAREQNEAAPEKEKEPCALHCVGPL
jgi:hypothetical protein